MITFGAADEGVSITGTIRTSGTEPKIKVYLEASGKDRERVSKALQAVKEALAKDWLRCADYGIAL